ncbi:MAG: YlcI/YnfO family protein [Alphaproteobacteria bacterium]
MTRKSTFPLRLPESVKAAVEDAARREGVSVNQFVATAVSEKLSVLRTAEFFTERRRRADWEAFDRIMTRRGGQKPVKGDEIPPAGEEATGKR